MKIGSNQFTNVKMINDNLGSEVSDIVHEHVIAAHDTSSYKFNV